MAAVKIFSSIEMKLPDFVLAIYFVIPAFVSHSHALWTDSYNTVCCGTPL